MNNNSLEVKLIEDIQSRALGRINDLSVALNKDHVLDPVKGKSFVDAFLWKANPERTTDLKDWFRDRDDTVYGSVASKLVRAIYEWKEANKELRPENIAIWVSYNSRLADTTWQESERVLTKDENLRSASYQNSYRNIEQIRTFREDKKIVERVRGLDSVWFDVLRDSFSAGEGNSIAPSIHYYLSKFDPHFKGIEKRIRTVVFFSEKFEEKDAAKKDPNSFIIRQTRQENDILLRSRNVQNDLYIKLPFKSKIGEVKDKIYKELFEQVVFGSGENKDEFPPSLTRESAEEWSKRYAAFLRGLILNNAREDLKKLADEEPDEGFKTALRNAMEEEDIICDEIREEKSMRREQNEIFEPPFSCMTNIYIKVPSSKPSTEGDLGSIIIFSDKVISPALTRIISSSIWAVFSHLREVEESVISKNTFKKHTSRSAIAAIMGRNMSHNVGSHVLWHLGRSIENSGGKCPPNTEHFLNYLQQRMDFIAQITTSPVFWCQSFNFKQLMESFDNKQTVLKENIARSYSEEIELQFDLKDIGNEKAMSGDIEVDIPGGMVGAQALYSILENIIRNAAKHGDRNHNNNKLRLEIRLGDPGLHSSSSYKNEWKKKFYKLTIADSLQTKPDVKEKLDGLLSETMIDDEGSVKSGAWGMKEIKICASYLRRIEQHNIDLNYKNWKTGRELQNPPIVEVEIECKKGDEAGVLAYSFYLLRPKMAAIINWEEVERKKDKEQVKNKFRDFGIDIMDEDEFSKEFDSVVLRHDFIVLPIEFYRANVIKHNRQNELPTRIFLTNPSNVALTELEDERTVFIRQYEMEPFNDAPARLKFFLWRKWIEKFHGAYHLYVRWNKFGSRRSMFNYQPDSEIKLQDPDLSETPSRNQIPLIEFIREDIDTGVDNPLVFDHQSWSAKSDLSAKAIFQESIDDVSPVRDVLNRVYHDLKDLKTLDSNNRIQVALSVFLLKESAATTIGILDNRIYRQGRTDRGTKGYGFGKFPPNFKLYETWEKRRVYFFDPKAAKENFELFVEQELFPTEKPRNFRKYDFLVLHQGDLDEIQTKMEREEKNFERVWTKLEQKAKHIVIVTGRGKPQIATDRKLRWVGYSALADELLGKSKIELVEMLYSLRATVRAEKL